MEHASTDENCHTFYVKSVTTSSFNKKSIPAQVFNNAGSINIFKSAYETKLEYNHAHTIADLFFCSCKEGCISGLSLDGKT